MEKITPLEKKNYTATGSDGSDKYHLWYYQVPSTHLYIKQ